MCIRDRDVIAVSEAEVFIYNGGESELWVEDILDAAGEAIPYRLAMIKSPFSGLIITS